MDELRGLIPDLDGRIGVYAVTDEPPDRDTVAAFMDYVDETIAGLSAAVSARDAQGVSRRGHGLRGMGGMVDAPEISVVGEFIEGAAERGDFVRAERLLEILKKWREQSRTHRA